MRPALPFALRRARVHPLAAVIGTALAIVLGAVFAPGLPTTDRRLHDGSVYVTNRSTLLIGKLNRQIDELASRCRCPTTTSTSTRWRTG